MTSSSVVRPPDGALRRALQLAAVFALVKLLMQFALTLWSEHVGYGYFRDEFYYIMCGRHLAWGYVDHGPIVALQARVGELLFGESAFGIRVLSAVAGAVAIFLTGVVTWALGGGRAAQALAMVGLMMSPMYIGIDGFLSMNSFEPVFWTTCVLALVLMVRGRSQSFWWFVFGVSAGVGLLNKPSMTFFLIAIGVGLLLTEQRRLLFSRHAAVGIGLLILIALPNVLWQMHHQWPTLEFLRDAKAEHKDVILGPGRFVMAQVLGMHPLNALLWTTGAVSLLRGRTFAGMRWLGFVFAVFFGMMWALHAKDYYMLPVYPPFIAAGAIAWKKRFGAPAAKKRKFALPVLEFALVALGILILPMASPVLAPEAWVRYTQRMNQQATKTENEDSGQLPQFYADRFAWNEQVALVVSAYRSLTPEEQQKVCIYGDNYGEAGAVDFLGHMQEPRLPWAISGHNNYWLWGPRGCSGELEIAISGGTPDELRERFESVTTVGHVQNKWAMPFENRNVYLLRGRKASAPFDWAKVKHYI